MYQKLASNNSLSPLLIDAGNVQLSTRSECATERILAQHLLTTGMGSRDRYRQAPTLCVTVSIDTAPQ